MAEVTLAKGVILDCNMLEEEAAVLAI